MIYELTMCKYARSKNNQERDFTARKRETNQDEQEINVIVRVYIL